MNEKGRILIGIIVSILIKQCYSATYEVKCEVSEPIDKLIPCELANFGGFLPSSPKSYMIHPTISSNLCAVDSIERIEDNDVMILTNHWGCSFLEKGVTAAQVGASMVLMTSSTNAPFSPGSDHRDNTSMEIPFVTISTDDARDLNSYLREGTQLTVSVHSEISLLEQCARRVQNYAEADMRGTAMDAFYRCYDPEMLSEPNYKNCKSALNISRNIFELEGAFESLEIVNQAKDVCWFSDYPDWQEPSKNKLIFNSQGEFKCETDAYMAVDWFECKVSKNRVEFDLALHAAEVHLRLGNFSAASGEYGQLRALLTSLPDDHKKSDRAMRRKACAGLLLTTMVRGGISEAMKLYHECGLSDQDFEGHLLWAGLKNTVNELRGIEPDDLKNSNKLVAPKECCIPDWKTIFSSDPANRTICELGIAHSQLGVLLDELGSVDLSNKHFKRYDKICSDAGKTLRTTLQTNVVARSEDAMHDERQKLLSKLKKEIKNSKAAKLTYGYPLETLDFLWTMTPPTMMIGYQNINDRKAHELISTMYQTIWPELVEDRVSDFPDDDVDRPLKVGFASSFLAEHSSVGRLMNTIIKQLSRQSGFDVYVLIIPKGQRPAQALGKAFNVELQYPLPRAAAQIAALELDVLVYPEIGMHSFAYFLSYQRCAPIQVAFWGHPVSQASPNIDYFLTSELFEFNPERTWSRFTEQVVMMESLTTMFEKPKNSEKKRWKIRINFGIPEGANLYVCAQSLMKFHPVFDTAIQRILTEDPNGILVIVYNENQIVWRSKLEGRFRRSMGVEVVRRVYFLPTLPTSDFQSLVALADVVLDPFPWGGGVTTLEALSTGRIVVTLPSEQSVVQLAAGFMKHMDVEELITSDIDEYILTALRYGTNETLRAETSTQILESHSSLYSNQNVLKEWASFLLRIAQRS
mmetsp:Transcript_16707/g.21453  ORF Transcript_16707/g.21453 Transcript_16707/m.21453 type:complete len:920 (+) Transcript_16707:96-2855(+)